MDLLKQESFKIEGIPCLLFGESTDHLYLFVHGQGGCKEEAARFALIASQFGWQTLSMDLPEHGERIHDQTSFDPWHVVPELNIVMTYANAHWNTIALRANSIGAWFCMLAYPEIALERCLFVSPITDMNQLIHTMMTWADVTEQQLECKGTIPTSFGQTLSWFYLTYVKEHPIMKWNAPTEILYGEGDHMITYPDIEYFTQIFQCNLSVFKSGEHWFHTTEQLEYLENWTLRLFENQK